MVKRVQRRTITEEECLYLTGEDLLGLLRKAKEIQPDDEVDDVYVHLPEDDQTYSLIDGMEVVVVLRRGVVVEGDEDEFDIEMDGG